MSSYPSRALISRSALAENISALRGATSDILAVTTFDRMLREKPDLVRVEVPQRGHTPMLDEPVSVAAIDEFLARTP